MYEIAQAPPEKLHPIMQPVTRRTATPDDLDTLDALFEANMRPHVERHAEWEPDRFRHFFRAEDFVVLEIDGQLAGMLKVIERAGVTYLAEIQVAAAYRNRGIGTQLLEELLDQADSRSKPLTLKVLKGNPAEGLYRRLGFRVDAEGEMHRWMKYTPK